MTNTYTIKMRAQQLEMMHQLMILANDEELYWRWATLVPDGATDEDFGDIAEDEDEYNEACDLFCVLIAKKGMRY